MKKFKLLSIFAICLLTFGSCHIKAVDPAPIKVRPAVETDVKDIVKNFKGHVSWITGFDDKLINRNIENVFVAYDSENILGYCRISKTSDKNIHINDLVTLPDARHCGCGRKLLKLVREKYPNSKIDLNPTKKSIGFYENIGFIYDEDTKICKLDENASIREKTKVCKLDENAFIK